MSGSSKGKKNRWYGYLEAGASSSAVLRDDGLDTGNARTLYLFNLARERILEYSREIVEPKLRELKSKESDLIAELDAAYTKARRSFKDRSTAILQIPERGAARRTAVAEAETTDVSDYAEDDSADEPWLDAKVE
jgi:hypothetical protein